ncbi:hypothetical protein ACHAPT_009956 [Fusarium lateritium]
MVSNFSYEEIVPSLQAILHCQNDAKWNELEAYIQPTVNIVGGSQKRDEFIAFLCSEVEDGNRQSRLDSYVVDRESQAIAARVIQIETAQDGSSTLKTFQYQEIILAWFVDRRLSTFKAIRDNDSRRAKLPIAKSTPDTLVKLSTTALDLKIRYYEYITSINTRTMEADFETFVQPFVMHNGRKMTTSDYIRPIREIQEAIESLHLEVQDMLVDNEAGQVAVRIKFTGVPVREWGNVEPNGKPVTFHEHVMYWFDAGMVSFVWAALDFDEYKMQLKEDSQWLVATNQDGCS